MSTTGTKIATKMPNAERRTARSQVGFGGFNELIERYYDSQRQKEAAAALTSKPQQPVGSSSGSVLI